MVSPRRPETWWRGAGEFSRTPRGLLAGDRRGEDAPDADPLVVADLAALRDDRGEGEDALLLHLQDVLDDALGVGGLGPDVDPGALDPDTGALGRLVSLG